MPSGFRWSGQSKAVPQEKLASVFLDSPNRFSANALLRPVTGDVVFPTVMHVMGPGEIAYMAQSRALYVDRMPMHSWLRAPALTVGKPHARLLEENTLAWKKVVFVRLYHRRTCENTYSQHTAYNRQLRQIDGVLRQSSEFRSYPVFDSCIVGTYQTHGLISKSSNGDQRTPT